MQSKNVYPFITLLLISWLYYLKHTTFANQGRDINKSVIKGYVFILSFLETQSDQSFLKVKMINVLTTERHFGSTKDALRNIGRNFEIVFGFSEISEILVPRRITPFHALMCPLTLLTQVYIIRHINNQTNKSNQKLD